MSGRAAISDDFRTIGDLSRDGGIIAPNVARDILARVKAAGSLRALKLETSLLDLLALPSTDAVLAQREAVRALYDAIPPHRRIERLRVQRDVDSAEQRCADAVRRDTIQATRPDGCWCLGYGGRDARSIPVPTDETFIGHEGTDRQLMVDTEVLREHCVCPEGISRAEYDAAIMRDYRERIARRAIIRRFGEARLPLEYQQHPWRDHPDRATVRRVTRWLADPKDGRDAHHWLWLHGAPGVGKSTILGGLAAELAESGAAVLYRTMTDLLDDVRATFGKDDATEELRQLLRRVTWLFLDDIGVEVPRDWIGELLYGVFNHRHNEHMPTVLASNLGPSDLGAHVGERIWGRIKRMALPIEMTGPDLRDLPHDDS